MNYEEFFSFAYQNIYTYMLMAFFLFVSQYIFVRRFCIGGFLDPFHITYTFTYATSYAVVGLLWLGGYIENHIFIMLLIYGFLFLFSLKVLEYSRCKFSRVIYIFRGLVNTNRVSLAIGLIIAINILLAVIIVNGKGFSLFSTTNRFEDNKGIGPVVRFWEYSSYFITAYLSISLHKSRITFKKKVISIGLIFYILFNSVISGAKSDVLFYGLACFYAQSVFYGKITYKLKHVFYLFLFGLSSVFIVLYFNFSSTLNTGSDIINIFSSLFIRFTDRVLSNGDVYYMGLPYDVIEKIKVDSFFVILFSPLLGISLLSSIAGYDVSSFELGRQVLLYHYPLHDIAGGPTDHFDLFAYKVFGLAGSLFIIFLSIYIYILRMIIKSGMSNHYLSAVYTVLWFNVISILLKPGMLLSTLLLPVIFFVFIGLLCRLLTIHGDFDGKKNNNI
ncbi:MAG: O-antigen polymerase [Plesiomonas sp.]